MSILSRFEEPFGQCEEDADASKCLLVHLWIICHRTNVGTRPKVSPLLTERVTPAAQEGGWRGWVIFKGDPSCG